MGAGDEYLVGQRLIEALSLQQVGEAEEQ